MFKKGDILILVQKPNYYAIGKCKRQFHENGKDLVETEDLILYVDKQWQKFSDVFEDGLETFDEVKDVQRLANPEEFELFCQVNEN